MLSQNEINNINEKFIKEENKRLLEFEKWAYKILRDECADYIMESDQNNSNVIYAYKQILSAISSEKNNVRMYRLLNDKNYNKKVNNIIRNNIKKIKEENNNKILNNNKKA